MVQANLANLSFPSIQKRNQTHRSSNNTKSNPIPKAPSPFPFHSSSSSVLGRPQSSPRSLRWPQTNSSNCPQCQIYGKLDHTALVFYNRHNPLYQAPPANPSSRQAFFNQFQQPQNPSSQSTASFESLPVSQHPDEAWFMDSGATHHMTPDINNIQQPTPYYGHE